MTAPICPDSARELLESIREARSLVTRLKDRAEDIGASAACEPLMDAFLDLNNAVDALHKPAGLNCGPVAPCPGAA